MDLDSSARVPPRAKAVIRSFLTAVHFFVLVAFVLPGACGAITGSDISPAFYSWKSAVALGVGSVAVAAVVEVTQYLLTRRHRSR